MIDHETGHFLQTWFDQYVDGFTVGPEDFMFELNKKEFADWRSQFVTSNSDKMGLRYSPMAFTEQGVAMLSISS
jgi:hypothetical protein